MAAPNRSRWILIGFVCVLVLVAFDQWSKAAIFGWIGPEALARGDGPRLAVDLHGHRRWPIAGEWLSFMTSCNPGAAFGQLDRFPAILVVGRCLAVVFLTVLLLRADPTRRVVFVAMVLVLAGAFGNVIDNLWTGCPSASRDPSGFRPREVRDFLDVWFQPLLGWDYHFPSFNVADSCISVGAVLWVLSGLGSRSKVEARVQDGAAGRADA